MKVYILTLIEREGMIYGYEIKWKAKKILPPKAWIEGYKNTKYEIIDKENYLEFIM